MRKISIVILAALLALSLVSCTAEQSDLTSINDYMASATIYKTDTGTFTFAEGVGETAIITDYVGLYTLHEVDVPEVIGERTVTSIGQEAFYYCTSATKINIPDTVVSIGDWAFAGCASLETIVIPASVTSIGKGAFNGCTSLKSVVFEGTKLKALGDYAFNDCSALESITLPEGLMSIGVEAFRDCEALTKITAPSTLKNVGDMAFYNCTGLNTEGALTLSSSIEEIGQFAFSGIDKNMISAPDGSYASEYVSEMRDLTSEKTK